MQIYIYRSDIRCFGLIVNIGINRCSIACLPLYCNRIVCVGCKTRENNNVSLAVSVLVNVAALNAVDVILATLIEVGQCEGGCGSGSARFLVDINRNITRGACLVVELAVLFFDGYVFLL